MSDKPKRYLSAPLNELSREKFILLTGPRQVGKTTMAKAWLAEKNGEYLNWDIAEDRTRILASGFIKAPPKRALVLDELHKYKKWKSWLKGLYDANVKSLEVVVTGSARLDVYQRGGDSLLGRHELLHLHPLSMGELGGTPLAAPPEDWINLEPAKKPHRETWESLSTFGGFPEPFYKQNRLAYRRWSNRRRELLIKEDLRELTELKQISLIEHLALLLPGRVGSPLSINSLIGDLQVKHDTLRSWIEALERLYFVYRISPYHKKLTRSLKKEKKLYLWDWAQVESEAAKFENMVAGHLFKSVGYWNDYGYGRFELCYWRDVDKHEVDFIIVQDGKPIVLVEAKLNAQVLDPSLFRLAKAFAEEMPKIQVIATPGVDTRVKSTRVVSADYFLSALV